MFDKSEYIYFLKQFEKKLKRVIYKIENSKGELTDNDRDIIKATFQAFVESEKKF